VNKDFYLLVREAFAINVLQQFKEYDNFKLIAILLFLAHYDVIMTRIRLLKSSITRAFFSASIKIIIFPNITSNSMLTLKKAHNLAIATFNSFSFFLYICIATSKFNFTIFTNFDFTNFTNFDLPILNMSIEDESRSSFYDASMLIELNFDNSSIKYSSKNCAILFNR